MAKRKRYTDEDRAMLVVMLQAQGYTGNPETNKPGALQSVAEYSKVPERTLRRWFNGENNPPPDNIVRHKKGDLSNELEDIVWLMTGKLKDDDVLSDMSGKDMATSVAILIDKIRLLRGLPTEIVEIIPSVQQLYDLLKAQGQNPSDVFNAMIAKLHAQQSANNSR